MNFSVIGASGVGQVIVSHLTKEEGIKVGDIDRSRLGDIRRLGGEVSASKLDAGRAAQVEGFIENLGVMVPECLNAERFLDEAPRYDLRIQVEETKGGQRSI